MCRRGLAQGLSVVVEGEERPARRTRAQTHLLRRLQERRDELISDGKKEKGEIVDRRFSGFFSLYFFLCYLLKKESIKGRLRISDFGFVFQRTSFSFFYFKLPPLTHTQEVTLRGVDESGREEVRSDGN